MPGLRFFVAAWRYRWLFRQFLSKEIKSRYLGSMSGILWVFIQPLAQLAVYSFVFSVIFKVRFPELGEHNFLTFVALGLWPWLAFAESLQRGTGAIQTNADLIRKVALPGELLVLAAVAAPFVVQGMGYLLVLLLMWALGSPLTLAALPAVFLLRSLLAVLGLAIGLLLSAFQVFLRDLEHVLASILMFWFYATPILYPRSLVPESLQLLIDINPMSYFIERMRGLLLFDAPLLQWWDLLPLLLCIGLCYLSWRLYRRCAAHFEDFL